MDVPKASFGNTNDGTGLDLNLITRFKVVLEVISSGHEKFATCTIKTAKLYTALYPWHPMSSTVHKILLHGSTVIRYALLLIGNLS